MVLTDPSEADEGRVSVWQCIGCGRIEQPQHCIGVCQDRRVEFVRAAAFDAALAQAQSLGERIAVLEALLRRIAHTQPREGEWERSYRAMQSQAKALLAAASDRDDRPATMRPPGSAGST